MGVPAKVGASRASPSQISSSLPAGLAPAAGNHLYLESALPRDRLPFLDQLLLPTAHAPLPIPAAAAAAAIPVMALVAWWLQLRQVLGGALAVAVPACVPSAQGGCMDQI